MFTVYPITDTHKENIAVNITRKFCNVEPYTGIITEITMCVLTFSYVYDVYTSPKVGYNRRGNFGHNFQYGPTL